MRAPSLRQSPPSVTWRRTRRIHSSAYVTEAPDAAAPASNGAADEELVNAIVRGTAWSSLPHPFERLHEEYAPVPVGKGNARFAAGTAVLSMAGVLLLIARKLLVLI